MNGEQRREHEAWKLVVKYLNDGGIDINRDHARFLNAALVHWGHRLHQLYETIDPQKMERYRNQAIQKIQDEGMI